jgi:hypothetical protein
MTTRIGIKPMKKTLLATTALAFVAAHASALDVELYGQVNKGLFAIDDGSSTHTAILDNSLSSTRFGLKGAKELDNGLTASVLFENEMNSNPTQTFTQASADTGTGATFTERQARVGLSGNFGGVYLGQQSTALDSALTQDLTGAQDVMSADYAKIGGGVLLYDTVGTTNDISIANVAAFSATNRTDSVRYDSPLFYGFQARASIAQGGNTEGAVFYDGAYGDFKLKGAAGVRLVNDQTTANHGANTVDRVYQASISAAHKSGLAGTLAYTGAKLHNKAAGADAPQGMYAKVGYAWDAYEVAADYGVNDNFRSATASDDQLKAYGLGAQYNMGNGVSVAALYRNYDAKISSVATDSVNLYGVNMRVKF